MFYLRQYINVNMKKMGIVASCVWIGGTVLKDKNSHEAVGEISASRNTHFCTMYLKLHRILTVD